MTRLIDTALGHVLADLRAANMPPPRVEPSTWQETVPAESAVLFAPDGSGMGVWLDLGLSPGERLAHLADQVQEWAVEELARLGQPTNWPTCPAHPENHPMRAEAHGELAVWTCPGGAAGSWVIGSMFKG